jgi:hypothetical protein
MNSAGMSVSNSTNKLVITAAILQLQLNNIARVTLDATAGVTVSNGGSSSVVVAANTVTITSTGAQLTASANQIQIVQGSNSISLATTGVNINGPGSSSVDISVAGIDLFGPSGTVRIGDTGTSSAIFAQGNVYATTGFSTNRAAVRTAGITVDLNVSATVQLHINGGIITGYSIIG